MNRVNSQAGTGIQGTDEAPPERRVFANRTLNLRAVRAIGYDMDYTLVHYRVDEWERAAFHYARAILAERGLPIDSLEFDPTAFTIGLTFDLELGNLLKATRFGHVVQAQHGSRALSYREHREIYSETSVELSEPRFEFMNTLFELSRAALWTQLIELCDARALPGISSYHDLYRVVDEALTETHLATALKAEIVKKPEHFIDLDPDVVQTLSDQRSAGKQLLLITNSGWDYTQQILNYAIDRFCPPGTTWRDLFDIVIVSANKPRFFLTHDPIYRVVDEDRSLLAPHVGSLSSGHVYFGGNARLVERSLGIAGGQALYVGDHLFGDVHVTKDVLRWRTALIARELEDEVADAIQFSRQQGQLELLMAKKVTLDRRQARLRLSLARSARTGSPAPEISRELESLIAKATELETEIGPLAKKSSGLGRSPWGPLMRAGIDKSLFARQVERYADVYTSRVSNLAYETPYAYLRAAKGSLPHDNASEPTQPLSIEPGD